MKIEFCFVFLFFYSPTRKQYNCFECFQCPPILNLVKENLYACRWLQLHACVPLTSYFYLKKLMHSSLYCFSHHVLFFSPNLSRSIRRKQALRPYKRPYSYWFLYVWPVVHAKKCLKHSYFILEIRVLTNDCGMDYHRRAILGISEGSCGN